MKSILISIKPQFVAKILNKEKTLEIRKTMPKCDLPIDVYIYCTKDKEGLWLSNGKYGILNEYKYVKSEKNGKVVAKFTLNKVEEINGYNDGYDLDFWTNTMGVGGILDKAGFINNPNDYEDEYYEMCHYLKPLGFEKKDIIGYAWHISNLEIFDKPKELSEFCGTKQYFIGCESGIDKTPRYAQLTKAPQSWCYIEGEEK